MGPKKAAAADGEPDDVSCDQLMKFYKKQASIYGIDCSKQIKKAFEDDWVENLTPIKKFHLWDEVGW